MSLRSMAFRLISVALLTVTVSGALALDAPTAPPILEVSGKITQTNQGEAAVFDLAMLEALGLVTVVTHTPWIDGVSTFEGVPMTTLLQAVGAQGQTVTAIALNDYVTTIPLSDFAEHGAILALRLDGEYMTVRNKGPLFIIYPFDSDPELRTATYYGRSAWQVKQLIVE